MNRPYPYYELPQIESLKHLVKSKAEKVPNQTAFKFRRGRTEIVQRTFAQVSGDVDQLGTYLCKRGFGGKHVAILGENSYEWIVAFLAVVNGGGVAVPLDKELMPEEVYESYIDSDCQAIICSRDYLDKANKIDVSAVLSMGSFQDYLAQGQAELEKGNREFASYKVNPCDTAAIVFTSGTTSKRKGVVLTQKSIASDINFSCKNFFLAGDTLSVLPFHHTFGLVTAVFMVMNYGHATFINSSLRRVQEDLQVAQPQTMFMVPLFIETFYKQILGTAKKQGREKAFRVLTKIVHILFKFHIDVRRRAFASVINAFGGELEYIICGGAPLNESLVKQFRTWGVNILNGYGITECSPVVSVNRNKHWRDGSVGLIIPGCAVKVSESGEVLVKGDNVMSGYYKDDESTKAAFVDSWFSTGDLGYLDADGFLFLTGRKKNLIILSNGENISPEELEQRIALDRAVSEVIVYGMNGRIVASIYPEEGYRQENEYFDDLIRRINRDLPRHKQISKVELRDEPFEKNTTQKILRYKVGGQKNV